MQIHSSNFFRDKSGSLLLPLESSIPCVLPVENLEFSQMRDEFLQQVAKEAFPFLLNGTVAPSASRNVDRERASIDLYLSQIDSSLTIPFRSDEYSNYFQMVRELADSLPLMSFDCRMSLIIPVYNEERIIERCLSEWLHQTVPGLFEITFVVTGKTGYSQDESASLIKQAARRSPIPIHLIDLELPNDFANVGFARKLGHDVSLLRSRQRPRQLAPLYFLMDDADCFGIPNYLVKSTIDAFDAKPSLDLIKRQVLRDPLRMGEHDLLHLERYLNALTELVFFPRQAARGFSASHVAYADGRMTHGQFWLRIPSSGVDTAISAEALALIDGGFEVVERSEDLVLAPKIALLRGVLTPSGIRLANDTIEKCSIRTFQDSRRFERLMEERLVANNFSSPTYVNFADEKARESLRSKYQPSSALVGLYSNFTSLTDEQITDVANQILLYYAKFLEVVFPDNFDDALISYASFLSCYLVGEAGSVTANSSTVELKNPAKLRAQFEQYRERLAGGGYRFQFSPYPLKNRIVELGS